MEGKRITAFVFCFLVFFCFFQKAHALTPKETRQYIALKKHKHKKIINTLLGVLTEKWVDQIASGYSKPRDQAALVTIKKGVQAHVLGYAFLYLPGEITKDMLQAAYKTALFLVSPDKMTWALKEFRKQTVKEAKRRALEWLLKKEMRVGRGELRISYINIREKRTKLELPYLLLYKPLSEKKAKVSVSFYSQKEILPPIPKGNPMGASLNSFWYQKEFGKDFLPPFILRVKGRIKRTEFGTYEWEGTPEVKTEWGREVPSFDVPSRGFMQRKAKGITDDLNRKIKAARNVFSLLEKKSSGQKSKKKPKVDLKKGVKKVWQQVSGFVKEKASFFSGSVRPPDIEPEEIIVSPSEQQEETKLKPKKEGKRPSSKPETPSSAPSPETPPPSPETPPPSPETPPEKTSLSDIEKKVADIRRRTRLLSEEVTEMIPKKKKVLGKQEEKEEKEKKEKKRKEEETSHPCSKKELNTPRRDKVLINEVAWMGTDTSYRDEWLELKNISGQKLNLEGWELRDKKDQIKVSFKKTEIPTNSFILLERTDDSSVPTHPATLIYAGSLGNSEEALFLFDEDCVLEDRVKALPEWPAGSNEEKRPAERGREGDWQTSALVGGSPKGENTEGWEEPREEETTDQTSSHQQTGGGGEGEEASPSPAIPEEPSWCELPGTGNPSFSPVLINEVAWMGTSASSQDEWLELKEVSSRNLSLTGWQLVSKDEGIRIEFEETDSLSPSGFFLLERTNDSTLPGKAMDKRYTGGLSNTKEEVLYLFDPSCNLVDKVSLPAEKESRQGSTDTGRTMERKTDFAWQTSADPGGTPKAENSSGFSQEEGKEQDQGEKQDREEPEPLLVSPKRIEFNLEQGNSSTTHLTLRNPNNQQVAWTSSRDQAWLEPDPPSGTLSGQKASEVEISVRSQGLAPGRYREEFLVTGNATTTVNVSLTVSAKPEPAGAVVINEVGWMGTKASAADEWIELYNASSSPINLQAWSIKGADTGECLNFKDAKKWRQISIPAQGYLLYGNHEDDVKNSLGGIIDIWDPSIGLNDTSPGNITLYNKKGCAGEVVDKIEQPGPWFAGGKEKTRVSMERIDPGEAGSDPDNWMENNGLVTNGKDAKGDPIQGTPKAPNSVYQTPKQITDLQVLPARTGGDTVTLGWTAPEDQDTKRNHLAYEVRYSLFPLNEQNWQESLPAPGEPGVSKAGTFQKMTVQPLLYNQTYYFAIKTRDGKTSSFPSNTLSRTTSGNFSPLWPASGRNNKRSFYADFEGLKDLSKASFHSVFNQKQKGYAYHDAVRLGEKGRTYVATRKGIYGLDANFNQRWKFGSGEDDFSKIRLGPQGRIFAISNKIVALDRLGNKLWESLPLTDNYLSTRPLIIGDDLYTFNRCSTWQGDCSGSPPDKSTGFALFSFDLDTGGLNWYFSLDKKETRSTLGWQCQPCVVGGGYFLPSGSADEAGTIYFDYQDKLWALNPEKAATGADPIVWQKDIESNMSVSFPHISPGRTLVSGIGEDLVGINTENGSTTWRLPYVGKKGARIAINPAGMAGVTSDEMGWIVNMNERDPETGQPPWEEQHFEDGCPQPMITDEDLYLGYEPGLKSSVVRWDLATKKVEETKGWEERSLKGILPKNKEELLLIGDEFSRLSP